MRTSLAIHVVRLVVVDVLLDIFTWPTWWCTLGLWTVLKWVGRGIANEWFTDGEVNSIPNLIKKGKLKAIISPNNKCSVLLKRTNAPIAYLNDQRFLLEKRFASQFQYIFFLGFYFLVMVPLWIIRCLLVIKRPKLLKNFLLGLKDGLKL